MRCVDARQLFDAYLNGELSSSMATELQAHRVKCADCRREFALLEVSGHVLRVDDDPVALDDNFTDRLIACMDEPKSPWTKRLRWTAFVGAPLAAAAVVAMAFVGVFDIGGKGQVAGVITSVEEVLGQPPVPRVLVDAPVAGDSATSVSGGAQAPDGWFNNVRSDVAEKQRRGEPLQRALDLTVLQLIDILEEAKRAPQGQNPLPVGSDAKGASDRSDDSDDTLPVPEGAYNSNTDR